DPGEVRGLRRRPPQHRGARHLGESRRHDSRADVRVRLRVPPHGRSDEPAPHPRCARPGDREEAMIAIVPADHFLIMTIYAVLVSGFFALLWRQERRDRWKLFGLLVASLVLGGLAAAGLMSPSPS